MEEIAFKRLLVVKWHDFQKCEKWQFLDVLQRLYIVRQTKVSKMADFVDEIEIDKIWNTAEIFPFMAKFVFYGLFKLFWITCMEETA